MKSKCFLKRSGLKCILYEKAKKNWKKSPNSFEVTDVLIFIGPNPVLEFQFSTSNSKFSFSANISPFFVNDFQF